MLVKKIKEWISSTKVQFEIIPAEAHGDRGVKILYSGECLYPGYRYNLQDYYNKNATIEFLVIVNNKISLNYFIYDEEGYSIDAGSIEANKIQFINNRIKLNT